MQGIFTDVQLWRLLCAGPLSRFLFYFFPDVLGNIEAAQIETAKLPGQEFYFLAVLEALVDYDPACLHDPA